MYAEYYGLTAMPFQLTPDRQFFFGSREHSRALSHLVYGLAQEEGFIVITGEIGAGKTMLVEHLWSQLDARRYVAARILTTQLCGDDLLRMAVAGFGLSPLAGRQDLAGQPGENEGVSGREPRRCCQRVHRVFLDQTSNISRHGNF